MQYTSHEISFICYNNRSINGVVKNFIPHDIDIQKLVKIESKLNFSKGIFEYDKFIEIDSNDLYLEKDDISIYPEDIYNLTSEVYNNSLNQEEYSFLERRGIDMSIVNEWGLKSLSNIKKDHLVTIGATTHPILEKILENSIEGIIIPLYENNILVNCAIRRISDIGKLKYTLACPDIHIWGINDINIDDVWICEGLFDMMALRSINIKAISVSAAMWSAIQLYKLIECNPKSITIFCDDDNVGLKSGFILSKFFNLCGIRNRTVKSNKYKDASEHIFQYKSGLDNIINININIEDIEQKDDNFNITAYLKNRKF